MVRLPPDDAALARRILGIIGCRDPVVEAGPDGLLDDWKRFVERCETGYRGSLADFVQDLSVRTVIDRMIGRLPPRLRARLEPEVRALDFRYRAIPRRDEAFLLDERLRTLHPPERCFWLYGIPESARLS
jgi:hypothetical protein